jgi:hypothetical protein
MESLRRSCQTSFVSTASWTLDKARLKRALAEWHATSPDAETRERINEWLMDLIKDPLHRGKMDPDHPWHLVRADCRDERGRHLR